MSKIASVVGSIALGAVLGFALSRALGSADHRVPPTAAEVTPRAIEILKGTEPLRRLADLSALLSQLGPDAVPALSKAFDSAPLDAGDPELIVLATWWAAFDPQAAFAWASADWRAGSGTVLAAIFREWAHRDPQDALNNLRKLRYPVQGQMARDAIYAGWDESGKPGLADLFNTLPMREQQELGQLLARRRVVVLGTKEAIRWAESFPNPTMRQLLALRVASAAAATNEGVREVSEWATPLITAAKQPTGFPRRIGTRWVQHDPLAAMAWLSSLPAGIDRDDGVAESFRDWMMKDFPAAEAWIREQTRGEMQPWVESAVSIFAKTNGLARPEESLELVARFRDQELRDSTSVIVLMSWMKRDREAAEAWLAKSNLSADVLRRVKVGLTAPAPQQPVSNGLPSGPLGPDPQP
jgi:hypothetical protein